jgi:hypothetical protein
VGVERFIDEVHGNDPELAGFLQIEEVNSGRAN